MIQTLSGPRVTVTQRPVSKLAVSITGRPYVSWSQINCMRRCPKLFSFRYVQYAKPEFVPQALKFGGAVHSALEAYFEGRLAGVDLSQPELHLLRTDTLLYSDGDTGTWEEAVVEMLLPADTDFLAVELAANENVHNDLVPPEFDGHYADVAVVTISSLPTTVIPEPVTLLAVGLSVVGLGRYVRKRRTGR